MHKNGFEKKVSGTFFAPTFPVSASLLCHAACTPAPGLTSLPCKWPSEGDWGWKCWSRTGHSNLSSAVQFSFDHLNTAEYHTFWLLKLSLILTWTRNRKPRALTGSGKKCRLLLNAKPPGNPNRKGCLFASLSLFQLRKLFGRGQSFFWQKILKEMFLIYLRIA